MTYSGHPHPHLLFIGEAWGAEEERLRKPFVGSSGQEFWRMLGQALPDLWPEEHARVAALFDPHSQTFRGNQWVFEREAWLHEATIAFTNVFNLRPKDNNLDFLCAPRKELPDGGKHYPYPALSRALYLLPEHFHHLDRLRSELIFANPNLVVCLGNTALWAICGATNIGSVRGTITQSNPAAPAKPPLVKVLPSYHPASVLYQWSYRPTVVIDLIKAFCEAQFPEVRRPSRRITINPTLAEVQQWVLDTLIKPPPMLAVDTETTAGHIDTISFARSVDDCIVIPFSPHRYKRGVNYIYIRPIRDGKELGSYWERWEEEVVWRHVEDLLASDIPKLFQNGLYDMQYLLRMGLRLNAVKEDSMLAHHALYPELPKGLGFLGSIYSDESSWKLMRTHHSDTEKRDE